MNFIKISQKFKRNNKVTSAILNGVFLIVSARNSTRSWTCDFIFINLALIAPNSTFTTFVLPSSSCTQSVSPVTARCVYATKNDVTSSV